MPHSLLTADHIGPWADWDYPETVWVGKAVGDSDAAVEKAKAVLADFGYEYTSILASGSLIDAKVCTAEDHEDLSDCLGHDCIKNVLCYVIEVELAD